MVPGNLFNLKLTQLIGFGSATSGKNWKATFEDNPTSLASLNFTVFYKTLPNYAQFEVMFATFECVESIYRRQ